MALVREPPDSAAASEGSTCPARLGPFIIEREIGRGGSGVVFAARLEGRAVALKVPRDDLIEQDRQRFLREAALLARVAHPAIVEILGSGTFPDGRPYLAMPLLKGVPLSRRIDRGALPVEFAIELFTPLAEAVVHLHAMGIVHRDIKLENVFYIESEARLVLLDFGIAREIGRHPASTQTVAVFRGTPATMAPERLFGARATTSSDVFELSVLLFAMLTGTVPWGDSIDPKTRKAPRRPADFGVDLPGALSQAIMGALATEPLQRPTAAELLSRLVNTDSPRAVPAQRDPFARETQDLLPRI